MHNILFKRHQIILQMNVENSAMQICTFIIVSIKGFKNVVNVWCVSGAKASGMSVMLMSANH